jgi:hypothetical protein
MQPELRARPMVSGSEVPWRPMPGLLRPHQKMPTGLLGPGGMLSDSESALRFPVSSSFWS